MFFDKSYAIQYGLNEALTAVADASNLPPIRGKWYYVAPTGGSVGAGGRKVETAVASIQEALSLAVDGDGIALLSYGATSAATTSYAKTAIDIDTNGLTICGICAPVRMFPRARIANSKVTTTAAMTVAAGALKVITRATGSFITDGWEVGVTALTAGDQTVSSVVTAVAALSLTVTDDLTESAAGITSVTSTVVDLVTVSGSNNSFYNMSFWNGGSSATEIGGVNITGHRNYLYGCHIVGGAGAASANQYSFKINAGQDNTFEKCVIGTDTVDRGDNADTEIILQGQQARNYFVDCSIVSWVTSGTAHGAVRSNGTNGGRCAVFENCIFNSQFSTTTPADVHLVTGDVCDIITHNCACYNFTGWGSNVAVDNAATAASAGGGIATTE